MKVHQTTIYDIAKELNISKSTVSRALTNHPEVKSETRKAILELAEKVIKLTQSKSKLIYKPLPLDDPMMRQPNISLAKKELDWSPKIELDEGLLKTIEFFKSVI
jgi:UDP-glucuronate decarboxylase